MWNVTRAEAGFPGSANSGFSVPATGIVANVVGFPGLMVTLPKCMVPFNCLSMTGFSRSVGPMEVPPVVIKISALSIPLRIASTCASTLPISL